MLMFALILCVFLAILIVYFIFEPAIQARKNEIMSENVILEQDQINKCDPDIKEDYLLSLVIPAYNEEERLPPMLHSTISYLQLAKNRTEIQMLCTEILEKQKKGNLQIPENKDETNCSPFQIVIANDGSTDGTVKAVHQFIRDQGHDNQIPIQVLTLKQNEGKGAAVRVGMVHPCNHGHLRLMVDADGATNIASLRSLLESMKEKETTEIVFGSRAHLVNESKAQRSKARTLLMNAFHFFVKTLCSSRIHDTQCGFKLFTKNAALSLFQNLHLDRWAFDTELVVIAENVGINIAEVGVEWWVFLIQVILLLP